MNTIRHHIHLFFLARFARLFRTDIENSHKMAHVVGMQQTCDHVIRMLQQRAKTGPFVVMGNFDSMLMQVVDQIVAKESGSSLAKVN